MASRSLGTLTVDLVAKIGGFTRGMTEAERAAAKSSKAIEQRMQRLAKSIDAGIRVAAAAAAALGGAIAVGVRSAINNADALDEMSQSIGVSVETLSRLQVAAKLGAIELETLQKSVGRLAAEQQKYAEGNQQTVELFDALGVAAVDAEGKLRGTEAVLLDLADVFASLPDGAQKTALAIDLFGQRIGPQLIPFLNKGSEGIAEMNRLADELGVTISSQTAQAASDFNDQVDLLTLGVGGLWQEVSARLLPDLIDLAGAFREGSLQGDGLAQTADTIADGIRGIVDVAIRAKDTIRSLMLGVVGMFDFAAASAAQVFGASQDAAELLARSQSAFGLSGQSFEAAFGPRAPGVNRAGGPVQFIDPPGSGAGTNSGAAARLDDLYRARANAADASKAQAAADRAAAEAARELERADAELQRRLDELTKQHDDYIASLDDLEANLAGPLAEAELEHKRRIAGLQEALDSTAISVDEATRAQMLYAEAFAKTKDELDPYGKSLRELLADMELEADLLGMTNAARVTELELRRLGIDVTTQAGQAAREAILSKAEELEALHEQIDAIDDFRSSFEDNVASVLDGSKSIKDALRDMVDDFIAQLARMAAQDFAESLFGEPGQSGGGKFGDWLGNFFGMFGGPKAAGGPVMAGVPYLVGEQGPELVIPKTSGTVIPARQTAAMLGGSGGMSVTILGSTSRQSLDRLAVMQSRRQRRAVGEFA